MNIKPYKYKILKARVTPKWRIFQFLESDKENSNIEKTKSICNHLNYDDGLQIWKKKLEKIGKKENQSPSICQTTTFSFIKI